MPRRKYKGGKRKSLKKSEQMVLSQQSTNLNKESITFMKNWLEDVRQNENDMEIIENDDIDQLEIDLDESECNLKELEVIF
jgi:mevalonate pyrophosphate decarboxylase